MRRFGEQPASCKNSFKPKCAPTLVGYLYVFFSAFFSSRRFLSVTLKSLLDGLLLLTIARQLEGIKKKKKNPTRRRKRFSLACWNFNCAIFVFGQGFVCCCQLLPHSCKQIGASWCKLMDHISTSGLCSSCCTYINSYLSFVTTPTTPSSVSCFLTCKYDKRVERF